VKGTEHFHWGLANVADPLLSACQPGVQPCNPTVQNCNIEGLVRLIRCVGSELVIWALILANEIRSARSADDDL
jgi:hypothetical protein